MRQSPTRLPFRGRAVSHSFFVNSEVKRQAGQDNLRLMKISEFLFLS
jgi:hypothetical protein